MLYMALQRRFIIIIIMREREREREETINTCHTREAMGPPPQQLQGYPFEAIRGILFRAWRTKGSLMDEIGLGTTELFHRPTHDMQPISYAADRHGL